MVKTHYLMNLYFDTPGRSEPVFKGVRPISAPDDEEAIREALGPGSWDRPDFIILRAVSAKEDRVIYSSKPLRL
jgi:hypothetical protein